MSSSSPKSNLMALATALKRPTALLLTNSTSGTQVVRDRLRHCICHLLDGIIESIAFADIMTVDSDYENLRLGYAYCVKGPASSTSSGATSTTSAAAAPTQSGIASNCEEYYTVATEDSCSKIETQFNNTFAESYQWNPAIVSNCESLWIGYAVCVAV